MRTVKIKLPDTFPLDSATRVAIGYFTIWGATSYPMLNIYPDHFGSDRDLVAVYREFIGGEPQYVIGAVWDGRKEQYSFHT